jgi:hypothetical protein
MGPQEIQVGMLKRLRGTPITRHDSDWGMVYSPHPPYEILQTRLIDFAAMQRMRRFSRFWDLVANSGNFRTTLPLAWAERAPFDAFMELSDWLYDRVGRQHAIALNRLAELVFEYFTVQKAQDSIAVAKSMWHDYQAVGRREVPEFLRSFASVLDRPARVIGATSLPPRQLRHLSRPGT